jgi:uncharacterized protein (TIGR02646 family)
MIRVDKSGVLEPYVLASEKGTGKTETKKAQEFYRKLREKLEHDKLVGGAGKPPRRASAGSEDSPTTQAFKFSAYSDPSVRQALGQLFHQKCAYCESHYAGTQPVDVEHWRPKARVDEDEGEEKIDFNHGYYWLAASWDNLLPSCIDCNRRREQRLESDGTVRTVGKGNRFPLMPGTKRANAMGEEAGEEPLLLNPYKDDPTAHLEFIEEGVIRARLEKGSGRPSLKGQASIEVYALNRTALVQDRREVLLLIRQRMRMVLSLLQMLDELEGDAANMKTARARKKAQLRAEIISDLLSHELETLSRFCDPQRPFSMMARQVIDAFIMSLT